MLFSKGNKLQLRMRNRRAVAVVAVADAVYVSCWRCCRCRLRCGVDAVCDAAAAGAVCAVQACADVEQPGRHQHHGGWLARVQLLWCGLVYVVGCVFCAHDSRTGARLVVCPAVPC